MVSAWTAAPLAAPGRAPPSGPIELARDSFMDLVNSWYLFLSSCCWQRMLWTRLCEARFSWARRPSKRELCAESSELRAPSRSW